MVQFSSKRILFWSFYYSNVFGILIFANCIWKTQLQYILTAFRVQMHVESIEKLFYYCKYSIHLCQSICIASLIPFFHIGIYELNCRNYYYYILKFYDFQMNFDGEWWKVGGISIIIIIIELRICLPFVSARSIIWAVRSFESFYFMKILVIIYQFSSICSQNSDTYYVFEKFSILPYCGVCFLAL